MERVCPRCLRRVGPCIQPGACVGRHTQTECKGTGERCHGNGHAPPEAGRAGGTADKMDPENKTRKQADQQRIQRFGEQRQQEMGDGLGEGVKKAKG